MKKFEIELPPIAKYAKNRFVDCPIVIDGDDEMARVYSISDPANARNYPDEDDVTAVFRIDVEGFSSVIFTARYGANFAGTLIEKKMPFASGARSIVFNG